MRDSFFALSYWVEINTKWKNFLEKEGIRDRDNTLCAENLPSMLVPFPLPHPARATHSVRGFFAILLGGFSRSRLPPSVPGPRDARPGLSRLLGVPLNTRRL